MQETRAGRVAARSGFRPRGLASPSCLQGSGPGVGSPALTF